MSTEREELFQIIWDGAVADRVKDGKSPEKVPVVRPKVWAIVHTILAAGYRKPRTVTTVEELDALPFGSVILDRSGLSLHKNEFTGWRASNGAKDISPEMLAQEAFPATVLHEPEVAV